MSKTNTTAAAPSVPCATCNGTGRATMPKPHADALDAVQRACRLNRGPQTSETIHALLVTAYHYDREINATMNILARLTAKGFIAREGKRGKFFLYRPC